MAQDDKRPPRPDDFRKDADSTAESHVVRDESGYYIADTRPPQSLADAQSRQQGYDPARFFDDKNAAKYVEGVSRPLPASSRVVSGKEADVQRDLLADYDAQVELDDDLSADLDIADD